MPSPIRRIVTGHDDMAVAKALMDGAPPLVRSVGAGTVSTLIWCTDSAPADISSGLDVEDMGLRQTGTAPPKNGTRFSIVDFPPNNPPYMHRTESLDYAIVLVGTVDMAMDDSVVSLVAGDVVVQRGTNHAWINRGDSFARVAFVLIDAKPIGIGRPISGGATAR
jgi:quercetin dioxygenase-like cupin family protein